MEWAGIFQKGTQKDIDWKVSLLFLVLSTYILQNVLLLFQILFLAWAWRPHKGIPLKHQN